MALTRLLFISLSTLLLSNLRSVVEACSCQPAHPQDHFCRADFVVKALVGRARLVELDEYGNVIKYFKNKQEGGGEVQVGDSDLAVEKINEELEEEPEVQGDSVHIRPAPVIKPDHLRLSESFAVARGPDTRMPGYNRHSSGMRGTHSVAGAPGRRPEVHARRSRRSSVTKSRDSRRRPHSRRGVGEAPGANIGPATPHRRLMMQYKVNVIKVFKGLETVEKERRNFLYTPPNPLCDVKFSSDRSPHVIMGRIQNGVMVILTCDYRVNLSEMTEAQSKNLIRNMHFRFKSCSECDIKVCNRGNCGPGATNPHQCQWKEWWTVMSPTASQFACISAKNGQCKWYNALEKSMIPEDISKPTIP